MKKDTSTAEAASRIKGMTNIGEELVLEAVIAATEGMLEFVPNMTTKTKKIAALEQHAVALGIGTGFMQVVAPRAMKMREDLEERGASESEARVNTAIWLAKVFTEIHKAMSEYESKNK